MSPMTHATWMKWHIHKKIHNQAMWCGHVAMMLPLGDILISAIMFPMHLFVCPKFKLEFRIVLNVRNFYLLFTHWFCLFLIIYMFLLCLLIIDELVELLIIINLLNGFLFLVVMNTKTMTLCQNHGLWLYPWLILLSYMTHVTRWLCSWIKFLTLKHGIYECGHDICNYIHMDGGNLKYFYFHWFIYM